MSGQFRTFRRLYSWWRDQLTPMGKLVFAVMVFAIPALTDPGAVWGIVFIAALVMLFVVGSVSFLYRPRLSVQVRCPRNWMRSESRVIRVEITNISRRSAYHVWLELIPANGLWEIVRTGRHERVVPPGGTITMSSTVRALRRGQHELPRLRATTLFPFQLVHRSETYRLPRPALILPFHRPMHSRDISHSIPHFARGYSSSALRVGLAGEYFGSREYQPGVPVRKWDYSSWARLGYPVVREYTEPRHPTAAVLLDTFFPAARCAADRVIPELEAMLSLAASMTDALIARGHRVDLLVLGERFHTRDEPFAGDDHHTVLECLALAQPYSVDRLSGLAAQIERVPVTWDMVFLVSHRWGFEQERLFQAATHGRLQGTRLLVQADGQAATPVSTGPRRVTFSQVETGRINW